MISDQLVVNTRQRRRCGVATRLSELVRLCILICEVRNQEAQEAMDRLSSYNYQLTISLQHIQIIARGLLIMPRFHEERGDIRGRDFRLFESQLVRYAVRPACSHLKPFVQQLAAIVFERKPVSSGARYGKQQSETPRRKHQAEWCHSSAQKLDGPVIAIATTDRPLCYLLLLPSYPLTLSLLLFPSLLTTCTKSAILYVIILYLLRS